jgi:hypothetical protein
MQETYAVSWSNGDGTPHAGRLELASDGLVLANGTALEVVEYGELRDVHVGRSAADRIGGRAPLVLERRSGEVIRVAGVGQAGIISELAEHLSSQLGEERVMSRAVVVVPLREGANVQAAELLRGGPPFDPATVGLERHQVFLTDDEAVFVFEAASRDTAERLVSEETFWSAVSAWKELVAGPPRLADNAYSWARPLALDDVSFEPTPGPGNSDGGDVF